MNKNRRNIRKRQFETNKSLRIYKTYDELYSYVHGENVNETDISSFITQERFENKDKIAEMFWKKKANVPIPEINNIDKGEKSDPSVKSASTDCSNYVRPKDEEGPVEFIFKPMEPLNSSYIKYKPKLTTIDKSQVFNKINYMITEEDWEDVKKEYKGVSESMKDFIEEIIDKLEKFTKKGEVQSLDVCKNFINNMNFKIKSKPPSETMLKAVYNAWINMRKRVNNALLRTYYKKPDQNDNSPIASFRSRVPEKMQTRRKNKNSQNSYMKLKLLRKEIFSGRNLLINVMKREKLKLAMIDLDYMEVKQMIKEKFDPNYQCEEFKEFWQNEAEILDITLPTDLAGSVKDEESISKDEVSNIESDFEMSEKPEITPVPDLKRKIISKQSFVDDSQSVTPTQATWPKPEIVPVSITPSFPPQIVQIKPVQLNEKVVIEPETVSQISIIFKKMKHLGIQFDPSRIKVSTHKPIKKEDYINLSKLELDEEQYYRNGIKPKWIEDDKKTSLSKIKYTIFKARNRRIYMLRKPVGGEYEVIDSSTRCEFNRIIPDSYKSMKRFKLSESDEVDKHTSINTKVATHEVNKIYSDFIDNDTPDSDDEITDDDSKSDVDDYTEGFISRLRKRRGKKRGANDTTISFKL